MHRILLADDEKAMRLLVWETLESIDCQVIEADNGLDALAIAITEKPSLIVMDWMMPGLAGIDVLRELKRNPATHSIPVIMLTARNHPDDHRASHEAGVSAFLTKPFSPAVLFSHVERLLAT